MVKIKLSTRTLTSLFIVLACGCDNADSAQDPQRQAALAAAKQVVDQQVTAWLSAAMRLQDAAPVSADRGWDVALDAMAITNMKQAWDEARVAYERIEGVLAPLFPDKDVATDARYDDYLVKLPMGDPDPFDDKGVLGMHGIERILWADSVPEPVRAFESALAGYAPARMPATPDEALRFRTLLAQRLVTDIQSLQADLQPLALDAQTALDGLVALVREQVEKVNKAATGEEESRYSQKTMRDLRENHRGCVAFYEAFRPWLLSRGADAASIDVAITAAFTRLAAAYAAVPGDAIPQPPLTWSSRSPSPPDLASPFGVLWTVAHEESDTMTKGRLAAEMTRAVERMGVNP